MDAKPQDLDVVHNEKRARFEIEVEGHLAEANYIRTTNGRIVFTHTEVPVALEGQGLAGRLARHVLGYAREEELVVVPLCPFMAAYIRRHPEYRDLVLPGFKL
ncbi:MAG: GNAT family N-acetyltransferase [Bacteroidota bacterium]